MRDVGQDAGTIYVVTCGLCGQSWLLTRAEEDEGQECLFCGTRGALHLGQRQAEGAGQRRIEARLQPVSR